MKRSEKEAIVAEVAERASRAVAMYFADFAKLTVAEETALRREFRNSGVEYTVVKNTLARKALEKLSGYDRVFDKLVGPTGIAFCTTIRPHQQKLSKSSPRKAASFN